ncbi:MAG: hypothetical protein M1834_006800 [Cirrosporium novae-zelandiae]|nr:MAG: hypothetical protein M1834_006800 [Cirrosporium novae-zelandiae]
MELQFTNLLRLLCALVFLATTSAFPTWQRLLLTTSDSNRSISISLFRSLEELSRIVDISYCVGTTGIRRPFSCAGRCQDFPNFELVKSWNTGPLLADSCGYIALSHPPSKPRIILAFRGTYSVSNTVVDLSTVPQEYIPYPGNEDVNGGKCNNCTVHLGFMTSWLNTRTQILPDIVKAIEDHPNYQLVLVGHSLGGAVAALAALEFKARGWNPQVTTFGEPRVGNTALNRYIDAEFNMTDQEVKERSYRRVTHVEDPVPLLPLKEWNYRMHAGEIYISKRELSPEVVDLQHCAGDEDPLCIARADAQGVNLSHLWDRLTGEEEESQEIIQGARWHHDEFWAVPSRYKLWELFFAHRDYFWRLGLCVPGGDPHDWDRAYPSYDEDQE